MHEYRIYTELYWTIFLRADMLEFVLFLLKKKKSPQIIKTSLSIKIEFVFFSFDRSEI